MIPTNQLCTRCGGEVEEPLDALCWDCVAGRQGAFQWLPPPKGRGAPVPSGYGWIKFTPKNFSGN